MKKIVSAVLVFVMMLSLAGCGISYDDIKGDWTAKTINGSDGIEVKMEGKDEIYMSMAYDKDKKTLTYKLDLGNGQTMEVVLEKGKADMTPVQQDAQTQTDGAVEEGATEAAQ